MRVSAPGPVARSTSASRRRRPDAVRLFAQRHLRKPLALSGADEGGSGKIPSLREKGALETFFREHWGSWEYLARRNSRLRKAYFEAAARELGPKSRIEVTITDADLNSPEVSERTGSEFTVIERSTEIYPRGAEAKHD